MQTRFLTAKAAAKIMMKQKSGVILTLTATPGGIGYPYNGGFAPACCAVENFSKNLAIQLECQTHVVEWYSNDKEIVNCLE